MLYQLHDFGRALLGPATHLAQAGFSMFSAPGSWLSQMPGAPGVAAAYELFYRVGKRYDKPPFGIAEVEAHGATVAVVERVIAERPFCRLLAFDRHAERGEAERRRQVDAKLERDPAVLVVAPLSGHHATLLRETVRTLLARHHVYVTDWTDARMVPLDRGPFTLDHYVGYLRDFMRQLGTERVHVLAVCQAAVPSLAAVALTAAGGEAEPRSLTLMGGPIDTRRNPTQVNLLATSRPLDWFERHMLHEVPGAHPGRGRRVYPGFLQHASFVAMNPARHFGSHVNFYRDVARGAAARAEEHRRFYDEYNAVLDMAAEYYLDCVRIVFQQHLLPRGKWEIAGERVAPEAIERTQLLTIEGELDDISGLDQTAAARDLCTNLPSQSKHHLEVEGAGHYGIFSGHRWRESVYPRVRDFIAHADAAR